MIKTEDVKSSSCQGCVNSQTKWTALLMTLRQQSKQALIIANRSYCEPLLQEVDAVTLRLQFLQDESKLQKGEVSLLL